MIAIDWDLVAVALAVVAVILRTFDRPRESAIVASFTLIASALGARRRNRRIEAEALARLER